MFSPHSIAWPSPSSSPYRVAPPRKRGLCIEKQDTDTARLEPPRNELSHGSFPKVFLRRIRDFCILG